MLKAGRPSTAVVAVEIGLTGKPWAKYRPNQSVIGSPLGFACTRIRILNDASDCNASLLMDDVWATLLKVVKSESCWITQVGWYFTLKPNWAFVTWGHTFTVIFSVCGYVWLESFT